MNRRFTQEARLRDHTLAREISFTAKVDHRRVFAQGQRDAAARLARKWHETVRCTRRRQDIGEYTLRRVIRMFAHYRMVRELWALPDQVGVRFTAVSRSLLVGYARRSDLGGIARVRAAMRTHGVKMELEDYVVVARAIARAHAPAAHLLRVITVVKKRGLVAGLLATDLPLAKRMAMAQNAVAAVKRPTFDRERRLKQIIVWHDTLSPEERWKRDQDNYTALYRAALQRCETAAERDTVLRLARHDKVELGGEAFALLMSCRNTGDLAKAREVVAGHHCERDKHSEEYMMYVIVHVAAGSFEFAEAYARDLAGVLDNGRGETDMPRALPDMDTRGDHDPRGATASNHHHAEGFHGHAMAADEDAGGPPATAAPRGGSGCGDGEGAGAGAGAGGGGTPEDPRAACDLASIPAPPDERLAQLLVRYVQACKIHCQRRGDGHQAFALWALRYHLACGLNDSEMWHQTMQVHHRLRDAAAAEDLLDMYLDHNPPVEAGDSDDAPLANWAGMDADDDWGDDDSRGDIVLHRLTAQYRQVCAAYMEGCTGPFGADAATPAEKAAWRDLPRPPHAGQALPEPQVQDRTI